MRQTAIEPTPEFTVADRRAHARWVLHNIQNGDLDWLPGDTRSAMRQLAEGVVVLADAWENGSSSLLTNDDQEGMV